MVGVELPRRKKGIKGTRPSTLAAGPTWRMGVGEGLYCCCAASEVVHAHSFHRAAFGQNHGLEGAVKHGLNLDVVRVCTIRVIGPFWLSSADGPQMAREKQLRPDHCQKCCF